MSYISLKYPFYLILIILELELLLLLAKVEYTNCILKFRKAPSPKLQRELSWKLLWFQKNKKGTFFIKPTRKPLDVEQERSWTWIHGKVSDPKPTYEWTKWRAGSCICISSSSPIEEYWDASWGRQVKRTAYCSSRWEGERQGKNSAAATSTGEYK